MRQIPPPFPFSFDKLSRYKFIRLSARDYLFVRSRLPKADEEKHDRKPNSAVRSGQHAR